MGPLVFKPSNFIRCIINRTLIPQCTSSTRWHIMSFFHMYIKVLISLGFSYTALKLRTLWTMYIIIASFFSKPVLRHTCLTWPVHSSLLNIILLIYSNSYRLMANYSITIDCTITVLYLKYFIQPFNILMRMCFYCVHINILSLLL